MKQLICMICLLLSMTIAFAQQIMAAKGSKVYIENASKNENAIKTTDEVKQRVSEWGYWQVVHTPQEADFKLKLTISASKGITATSWGGTSYQLIAQIADKKNEVVWESNAYRASPNGTNGFNAGKAVAKKLMRDLKKKYKD